MIDPLTLSVGTVVSISSLFTAGATGWAIRDTWHRHLDYEIEPDAFTYLRRRVALLEAEIAGYRHTRRTPRPAAPIVASARLIELAPNPGQVAA